MKRTILWGAAFALMIASLYLVFLWVPTEKVMGIVQRIFYLMVPMGWLALLSFTTVFVGSIIYLIKRSKKWDRIALSAAEVGMVFTTLTLVTGSIWAKPIWGVWWDWGTPRLVSALILWFIYLAYFMSRSFASEESQGARFAAAVGIIGFADIPIIVLSTTLWSGLHPPPIIFQDEGLAPEMLITLQVSLVAFTILYAILVNLAYNRRKVEAAVAEIRELQNQAVS